MAHRCAIFTAIMFDHIDDEQSSSHLGFSQRDAKVWARASGLNLDRWSRIIPGVDVRGPGLFSALMTRRAKA